MRVHAQIGRNARAFAMLCHLHGAWHCQTTRLQSDASRLLCDLYVREKPRSGVCASLTHRTRSPVVRGWSGRAWRGLIVTVY